MIYDLLILIKALNCERDNTGIVSAHFCPGLIGLQL